MTAGIETVVAHDWIKAALDASAALATHVSTRIYYKQAPNDETAYPFVVFQNQSAEDVRGVGLESIMSDTLYLVKAIAQATTWTTALKGAVSAVHVALTSSTGGSTADGNVWTAVRMSPFELVESEGGKEFRHLGGIYRIYAQGS